MLSMSVETLIQDPYLKPFQRFFFFLKFYYWCLPQKYFPRISAYQTNKTEKRTNNYGFLYQELLLFQSCSKSCRTRVQGCGYKESVFSGKFYGSMVHLVHLHFSILPSNYLSGHDRLETFTLFYRKKVWKFRFLSHVGLLLISDENI